MQKNTLNYSSFAGWPRCLELAWGSSTMLVWNSKTDPRCSQRTSFGSPTYVVRKLVFCSADRLGPGGQIGYGWFVTLVTMNSTRERKKTLYFKASLLQFFKPQKSTLGPEHTKHCFIRHTMLSLTIVNNSFGVWQVICLFPTLFLLLLRLHLYIMYRIKIY